MASPPRRAGGPTASRAPRSHKRTRLDVDARRAQLVELGLTHFGDRPYDEVSVDEIAEHAGISKALVFHYFPTKKDLYVATVREAARRVLARTEIDDTRTPLERVRDGLDAYLSHVKGHGRAYVDLLRGGGGLDGAVARVVEETRAEFLDRLTSGFERAGSARGALPARTRIALRGWLGMVEGASVEWIARGGATRAEVRDLLVTALLDLLRSATE